MAMPAGLIGSGARRDDRNSVAPVRDCLHFHERCHLLCVNRPVSDAIMNTGSRPHAGKLLHPHRVFTLFKYTVYCLLAYNAFLFFQEDIAASAETFGDTFNRPDRIRQDAVRRID